MKQHEAFAQESLRARMCRGIGLPPEVAEDAPQLVWTAAAPGQGRGSLLVEGHRGILEFSDAELRLQTAHYPLRIRGSGLRLQQFNPEKLLVSGNIWEAALQLP